MNFDDQRARQIRIVAALILSWGLVQWVMFFPSITYTPSPDGHGGTTHWGAPSGITNILCGVGIFCYSRLARSVGLLFAWLRFYGCLLDLLDWCSTRLTSSSHLLDPMPEIVQKIVFVPFFLAQVYIIWVLTRDEVIARFESPRRTPGPLPTTPAPPTPQSSS